MARKKIYSPIDEELEQSVYINPLTDFGFKKLFQKKELMISFLNDIVRADIKDIQYEPTEGLGAYPRERKAIFDILCTTQEGEHFIVEMQLGEQTYFRDRALFYASHAIRKQAPRKKYWNYELKGVYVVSILNFTVFKEEEAQDIVIERVYLYREKAGKPYSDKQNFVFVELPKFRKQVEELETNTDWWLFLLRHTFELKTPPPEIAGEIFKLFLEEAKKEYLTQEEMETYAKSLRQSYEVMDIANFAKFEGRREGLIEGLIEGEKRIARKLLQKGMGIDEILSITSLTRKQIKELQKNQDLVESLI
jgi:predicted transposase/invertase (TIGR01784 family)